MLNAAYYNNSTPLSVFTYLRKLAKIVGVAETPLIILSFMRPPVNTGVPTVTHLLTIWFLGQRCVSLRELDDLGSQLEVATQATQNTGFPVTFGPYKCIQHG